MKKTTNSNTRRIWFIAIQQLQSFLILRFGVSGLLISPVAIYFFYTLVMIINFYILPHLDIWVHKSILTIIKNIVSSKEKMLKITFATLISLSAIISFAVHLLVNTLLLVIILYYDHGSTWNNVNSILAGGFVITTLSFEIIDWLFNHITTTKNAVE